MEPVEVDDLELGEPERPGRDILEYLEVPFRYPRYFWVPFAGVCVLAIIAMLAMPKKFRSATLILVEHNEMSDYFVTQMAEGGIAQSLQTIREVVLSRTNLEKMVEEHDPYPDLEEQPRHVVVETMRRAIGIGVRGRDSFSIEYVNKDPYKAMTITNALARQFIDDARHIRDNVTTRTYAFVESNLDEARATLEERERALRQHKQQYWGALPEQLDSNLRVLQQLQMEQQTLGGNLRVLEERRATLERALLEGRRESGAGPGPASELARLNTELTQLRNRYTAQHPDVLTLQLRIERLEDQMTAGSPMAEMSPETASTFDSLKLVEREIDMLHDRREQLDQKIALYQTRVEQTPRAEQELATLIRDYEQLRDNYSLALKKQLEADAARKLEQYWKSGYFRVLDEAHLPRRPIRPYAVLLFLVGLVGGTCAGLVASLAGDFLDRSVKTEREAEQLVSLPVLVTLPRAGSVTGARAPSI